MKKRFLALIICFIMILPACGGKTTGSAGQATPVPTENPGNSDNTDASPVYYVRIVPDYADLSAGSVYMELDGLESAKAYADENSLYGSIVADRDFNCIYSPLGSEIQSEILYQGKLICDYIRDNGFSYGYPRKNPAFDCSEKLICCDRLVDWVLYRVGFTDQSEKEGCQVDGPELQTWCKTHGLVKISKKADILPGDIIFLRPDSNGYPQHTFVCGGSEPSVNKFYRYDGGNENRVHSTQPSLEKLDEFMFAYRIESLPEDRISKKAVVYTPYEPFSDDIKTETVWKEDFDSENIMWEGSDHVIRMKTDEGYLKFRSSGNDPYIVYGGDLNIACDEIPVIRVKYSNGTPGTQLQIFWTTDTENGFSESRSVSMAMPSASYDVTSGKWQEIVFDMRNCSNFTGTLKKLRIDTGSGRGDFAIESISLEKITEG